MNNLKKEFELEESVEANVLLETLGTTLKKITNWKMLSHVGIYGF